MASRITEGMKNTANRAAKVERIRLPRFIGASGVIGCFDATRAEGQALLYGLEGGAFQGEFYVFHHPPLDATYYPKEGTRPADETPKPRRVRVLVSNRNIFCLTGTAVGAMTVDWHAPLLLVMGARRINRESMMVVDIKGNPLVSQRCGPFYTHELSYVCMVVQRLAGEAQGSPDEDELEAELVTSVSDDVDGEFVLLK